MDVITFQTLLLLVTSVFGKPTVSALHRAVREFNNTTAFTKIIAYNDISERDAIYMTPEVMFVGKLNGEILRCLYQEPSVCEMFYSYSSSSQVTAIVINGEYLYASLVNGVLLRCSVFEKNSCSTFCNHNQINALVVAGGYIHAGMQDGRMLRCELHLSGSCRHFNTFGSAVTSLAATERYIYAALLSKEIWQCAITSGNSCRLFDSGSSLSSQSHGLIAFKDTVIGITKGGTGWTCIRGRPIQTKSVPSSGYTNAVGFHGTLYTVQSSNIWACDKGTFNCSIFDNHAGAVSIAFAYSTYRMQQRFVNEGNTCLSSTRCPPFMTYYEINQRPILEVFVRSGRLYNCQGILVDTGDADVGHSGRAAIFAMGVDGQILVSNVHNTVLRTSSLFAGNPVASAGEIVVEDGVIRSIRACSDHYQPDVELNKQVVEVLNLKGYTDRIESLACCSGNACGLVNVEDNTMADVQ